MESKKFILHWLDGKIETVKGRTIREAMNNAGIGAGALAALNYYESFYEATVEEYLNRYKKKTIKKICKNCKWYNGMACENDELLGKMNIDPEFFPDEDFGCNLWEIK